MRWRVLASVPPPRSFFCFMDVALFKEEEQTSVKPQDEQLSLSQVVDGVPSQGV